MAKKITIALAGNPNSGKTTIFNALTGSNQHVGNYPGVTVEKVEGRVKYGEYDINIIDLPGTYSLTANSMDELVARHFIIEEKPDVIVNIVDSSNLERNLYLSTQIMELGVPMVLAFNMHDIALGNGVEIDKNLLSELLGRPIVFVIGTKKIGVEKILEEAISLIEGKFHIGDVNIRYGKDLEGEIAKLEDIIIKDKELVSRYSPCWVAIKSLENDKEVIKRLRNSPFANEFFEQLKTSMYHLKVIFSDEAEAVIADRRYGFISGACSEATKITKEDRHTLSDKIDRVMINRVLGFPIFLGLMWLVFQFSFKVSEPVMGWIETGIGLLGDLVGKFFPEGSPIQSLAVDGVIAGVGGVLVFVPIIFLMFFAIAILEYSGYMARAAFIMDRLMHKIGLHGRSFIPMLLGFGCNVPAIMATRTIEDRRDRLVTILVSPFMSCGARLPVYALFIGAFFPQKIAGNVLFSLYLLGIMVAVVSAKVFRKYVFRGEAAPFVMELPPYRIPTLKAVVINMCQRGMVYLKKAGTIILAGCLVIWFLSNFPWNPSYSKDFDALVEKADDNQELVTRLENEKSLEKLEKSYAGIIGKAITPVFRPLGIHDWRLPVGLIGGFVAKEIVVGTLGTLYSVGEADEESVPLKEALQNAVRPDGSKTYNPLVAYSIMVFMLLYVPCIAVIAVIKRETNSWRWPIFTVFYTTAVAWVLACIVYQVGNLFGLGN